jgi:hypothetical protein
MKSTFGRARALADKVRQENETRWSPAGGRERLVARRDQLFH